MGITIGHIWEAQDESRSKGVLRHRVDEITSIPVSVGTIAISGYRVLLLELSGNRERHRQQLQKFRGVEIEWLPRGEDAGEIALMLVEPDLLPTFTMLVEDILDELAETETEAEALISFRSVVTNWRRMFDRIRPAGLPLSAQIGLYGELRVMQELIEAGLSPRSVLHAWAGPDGASKDFWWDSKGLEVKSTVANRPVIRVTNELQLDYPIGEQLWLGLVSLFVRPGNNHTLPSLVASLAERFQNDLELAKGFRGKLIEVGYLDEHAELYADRSFALRNLTFYEVEALFPRLTREDLPDSVFEVSYCVDPAACSEFITDLSSIADQIINYA